MRVGVQIGNVGIGCLRVGIIGAGRRVLSLAHGRVRGVVCLDVAALGLYGGINDE